MDVLINRAISVASKDNYIDKEISYLKNVSIVEFDISAAGLSTLSYKSLVPQETIEELRGMEKTKRNIKIGLILKRYPELNKIFADTLAEVRQEFIRINEIQINEILTIKKDAIFLINKNIRYYTVFGHFTFVRKNEYTSYMRLENKEFYLDSLHKELHTKGLRSEAVELSKDHLLKDIKTFMLSAEKVKEEQMYGILSRYRSNYLNRRLPVETYRNLEDGLYHLNKYSIMNIDETLVEDVDISQNYVKYILPIIRNII